MSWLERIIVGAVVGLVAIAVILGVLVMFGEEEADTEVSTTGFSDDKSTDGTIVRTQEDSDLTKTPRSSSIRGRVVDQSNQPIRGADVSLFLESSTVITRMDEKVAETNANGTFLFKDLSPGTYTVKARVRGYALQAVGSVSVGDDVELIIAKGGSVVGSVWLPSGSPATKAKIIAKMLNHPLIEQKGFLQEVTTRTDSNGQYRLTEMTPGTWKLLAEAGGGIQISNVKVAIKSGRQVEQDIDLAMPNQLKGRVIDSVSKEPMAGAELLFGGSAPRPDPVDGKTKTDDNGYWSIEMRPGGMSTIRITAGGYVPSDWQQITWDTTQENVTIPDFSLKPGAQIKGVVVSHKGKPVKSAKLDWTDNYKFDYVVSEAYLGAFSFGETRIKHSRQYTNAKGEFVIDTVPPNTEIYVVAHHPEHLLGKAGPMTCVGGKSIDDVRIVLPRGSVLKGRITDENKKPIQRAKVIVRTSRRIGPFASPLNENDPSTFTDSDGKFRISPLNASQNSTIRVEAVGYERTVLNNVHIPTASDVQQDIVMKDGASITGVVRRPNGRPYARVQVMASLQGNTSIRAASGAKSKTRSDSEGKFTIKGLPDGNYTVVATHPSAFTEIVNGVKTGTRNLEIVLGTPGAITGVLYCPDPDLNVTVSARDATTGRVEGKAVKAGEFTIENLRPGIYDIVVAAPKYQVENIPGVSVDYGSSSPITINLVPEIKEAPEPKEPVQEAWMVERPVAPNTKTATEQFPDQQVSVFVAIGSGVLTVGGEEFRVSQGHMQVIPPGITFSFSNNTNSTTNLMIAGEKAR